MIRHDGVKECDCCEGEVDKLYWYGDLHLCEECWFDQMWANAEEVEDDE